MLILLLLRIKAYLCGRYVLIKFEVRKGSLSIWLLLAELLRLLIIACLESSEVQVQLRYRLRSIATTEESSLSLRSWAT